MKLRLPLFLLFPLSPATAANCSRRHRRTLSAITKKPASLGWLPLPYAHQNAQHDFHAGSFSSRGPLSRSPRSLQLTIQTPSGR